jgi:hypothetical protein
MTAGTANVDTLVETVREALENCPKMLGPAEAGIALDALSEVVANCDRLRELEDEAKNLGFVGLRSDRDRLARRVAELEAALETISRPDEAEFPSPGWQENIARAALAGGGGASTTEPDFLVYDSATNNVLGEHSTRAAAEKQAAGLNALNPNHPPVEVITPFAAGDGGGA